MKLDYLNLTNPETYKLDKSHIASRFQVKNEFSKPKYTPWRTDWYKFFRKRINNVRLVLLYKNIHNDFKRGLSGLILETRN